MFSLIRHSIRSLLRTPVFTSVALITLALGIGVNTSMFNLVDVFLFRPAPYPDAERIVRIMGTYNGENADPFAEPDVAEIRDQVKGLESYSTYRFYAGAIAEPGQPPERVEGATATASLFEVVGLQPILGRTFTAEEEVPGRDGVIVISHSMWQSHFSGDPSVVGKTIRMNGEPVTVIGVMPSEFGYPLFWGPTKFWRPLNYSKDQVGQRDYRVFSILGKLKQGYTPTMIDAELNPLMERQLKEHPRVYTNRGMRTQVLHVSLMDSLGRKISWMLVALAGFVLLIACSNLANLQLARSTSRLKDLAIRSALGASRRKLIVQQLVECVILSVAGGALGIVVALWTNSLLEASLLMNGTDRMLDLQMNFKVIAITATISLLSGILFGIVPAFLASRSDMNAALKQQTRGSTGGKGYSRARNALIVGEIALALILLTGASLMVQTFSSALDRDPNWDTARVITANISISENTYDTVEKRLAFFDALQARVARVPGVDEVALSTSVPLFTYGSERAIMREGDSENVPGGHPKAHHVMVTNSYFAAMGIEIKQGRTFSADIKTDDPQVVIINEALANHLWPGENPIGKRLAALESTGAVMREVVGVVDGVAFVTNSSRPGTLFQIYRPMVQEAWSWIALVVRSETPASIKQALRLAVADVNADVPLLNLATVPEAVARNTHNLLVVGKILMGFALLGLLLAGVGIYGVIASVVAQRKSEFGIRLALGAKPRDVLRLVLVQGLKLTAIGMVLGLLGALMLNHFIASMMPVVSRHQGSVTALVTFILFLVALFACWLPAMRATRVDPIIALRAD